MAKRNANKRLTPEERLERFHAKYVIDENGCWMWTAARKPNGYGMFAAGGAGNSQSAHRWSYEQFVGPIPEGLQLDHLCRNRACVNPAHLEPVTCRTNLLRGDTVTAQRAAVTHCPQGHAYDEANTYIRPGNGGRDCRTCRSDRRRRHAQKARHALSASESTRHDRAFA